MDAAIEYAATLERFVTLVSGRGLFLSGKDRALAERWHGRGIPLEVACRALAEAYARLREDRGPRAKWPRSLKFFEPDVVRAAEREDVRVEPATAPEPTAGTATLAEELGWIRAMERDPRRAEAWGNAARAALELDPTLDRETALEQLDAVLAAAFFERLTAEERADLEQEAEALLKPERRLLGARGLEGRRRAILRDALEARFGLMRIDRSVEQGARHAES